MFEAWWVRSELGLERVALLSCGSTPAPGNNTARRSAQIILFIYSGEIPEKCPDAVNYQTTAVLFLPHSQRGNARCMPLPTATTVILSNFFIWPRCYYFLPQGSRTATLVFQL
jgi:hypothetical protein